MIRPRTFGIKITIGFAVSFFMLLVIGAVGYVSIARLLINTHEVRKIYATIGRLSELLSVMKDAETGQRGYVLTGNDAYLEPYRTAGASIPNVIKQLREMIADSPNQQRRLDQALGLIESKMAELKQTIDLRRAQGFDAAVKLVETNRGKVFMDGLQRVVAEMNHEEDISLREGKARVDFSASLSEATIILVALFALALAGLIGWYITSSLTRQIGSAAALLQSSSGELQAVANQQVSGSTEQATAMNEIATTISELLSTSRQIAESAQRVAEFARETARRPVAAMRPYNARHNPSKV